MTEIQTRLFAMRDEAYKAFQCGLMPSVDPGTVIGVRKPALRKFGRELSGRSAEAFLDALPHQYYEENNLHGFLIERCGDFRRAAEMLDAFLPYVNNWATCDSCAPKIFARHLPELLPSVMRWISSAHVYTVRFGIGMLRRFYLGGAFRPEYLETVAAVRSDEYYVNMMRAWFFADALAAQYGAALPYLEERRLDAWTHGRTIQKAAESRRIPPERKAYLRGLKDRPARGQGFR